MVALRLRVQTLLRRLTALRRVPPILLQGETGTGKTFLARLIHRASPRAAGPFVDLNCAAMPETLLESELFGHERFAFTDAKQAKAGLFQAASGGVLFLDEIGLMPMGLQAKLLKAIDEGVVRRIGATRNEAVDVAVITATNEDLRVAMREKRFRQDLYSRIAVLSLELPPLRAREGDILLLAEGFLARACAEYGLPAKALAADARATLRAHGWPENVRELRNAMERVALEVDGDTVGAEALALSRAGASSDAEREEEPKDQLLEALRRTRWNITRTAELLGLTRTTVRARIQRYGLRPPEDTTAASTAVGAEVRAGADSLRGTGARGDIAAEVPRHAGQDAVPPQGPERSPGRRRRGRRPRASRSSGSTPSEDSGSSSHAVPAETAPPPIPGPRMPRSSRTRRGTRRLASCSRC